MNNATFKLAVPWVPPWLYPTTVNNITRAEGTSIMIAHYIEATMKRPIEYIDSKAGGYGTEISPGNWTGSVGMALRGEVDCVLGIHLPTYEGFQIFGYTSPIFENTFRILSGPPRKYDKVAGSLLSTVTKDVWIALLVTWIIISGISYLFAKAERCLFHKDVRRESLWGSMFSFYGLLFERGYDLIPRTDYSRLVLAGWLILCEVLMSGIAGTLSSKMSIRDIPERIDSIQDILDRPDLCVYIPEGIFIESFLKFSTVEIHQKLWKKILSCNGIIGMHEIFSFEVFDKVYEGSAVIMANAEFVISEASNRECRHQVRPLYLGKEIIPTTPNSMIYRKNLDPVSVELYCKSALLIVEGGDALRVQKQSTRAAGPCYAASFIPSPLSALNIQHLDTVFQIWITGMGISIFIFISEMFVVFYKKKKEIISVGLNMDTEA